MRKKICVFIGEIGQEYQRTITENIAKRANELDYDVVFICSYGSYNEDIMYAEGEKACIYLPDCSVFDGIIVTEDVFDIQGMADELYSILKKTAHCPIVYLRTDRPDAFSIQVENKESIKSMVRHFTDVHGFTDLCYMSGKKESEDAIERLDGFLEVMAEHNLPVTEHMIFHGDYWRFKGEEAVNWFMEGRDTYPQAIICANDYMALSICEELRKRGVRVPEDVCVSGMDFVQEARYNEPTLTSLEVYFDGMAVKAVDIIDAVNNGEKPEHRHRMEAKLCLHSSCGCGGQYGAAHIKYLVESLFHHVDDTKNTLLSTIDYQDALDVDEYLAVADKYRRFLKSDKALLCFCDGAEKDYESVEHDSSFTDKMVLERIFEQYTPAKKVHKIFPRKMLLPEEYWETEKPVNYCLSAIHFKNIIYGYMAFTLPTEGWFDIYTQGFLMTLSNAIENSNVHRRMERLEEIRALYQRDPLTGIYNRRGFDKLLQERYALAKTDSRNFALISIDMDNLKEINDTYGHGEGDRALSTLAKTLAKLMKAGDFCARVGGDEFAAVVYFDSVEEKRSFKKVLAEELERASEAIPQYDVKASVGICEVNEPDIFSLVACVQEADRRMYADKKERKKNIR